MQEKLSAKDLKKMSKEAFLNSMKELLGDEYESFEASLNLPAFRGVYVNTLKCNPEKFLSLFPFETSPTPFSENGFYIENELSGIGKHPLHHAGAFYVQEPSAMSAAAALEVKKGDKVLDLCAAPGGKTTALAGALAGTGLLWSNEYVKSRAFTLLSNCERIGVKNCVVSSASAEALARELPCFFDKILVDAPCSGEGMLRREKAEYEKWSESNITLCAERQRDILKNAAKMLKNGGELVYSTCTFNRKENEDIALWFLSTHPEFELVNIDNEFGSPGFGMPEAKRVFPKDGGEGHFVVKFKKHGGQDVVKPKSFTGSPAPKEFYDFYKSAFSKDLENKPFEIGGKVYIIPDGFPATKHLNILRAGILAGEMKGKLFFPSHALYSASEFEDSKNKISLSLGDKRLTAFLHGEEIDVSDFQVQKGFCGVYAEGIALGFGKVSNMKLKNHYPKGLRNLN